jgi:hypothetical protein
MTQIDRADDPRLVALQSLMDEAGESASFQELDPFGERHGSWQRTIHAWSRGLDRYVVAAITSLDEGDEITVMAGAEERVAESIVRPRFRRFDVGSIRLLDSNLNLWPVADIKNLLAQAVRMSIEIQPLQLEEMGLLAS